jgi:hypothetical protein
MKLYNKPFKVLVYSTLIVSSLSLVACGQLTNDALNKAEKTLSVTVAQAEEFQNDQIRNEIQIKETTKQPQLSDELTLIVDDMRDNIKNGEHENGITFMGGKWLIKPENVEFKPYQYKAGIRGYISDMFLDMQEPIKGLERESLSHLISYQKASNLEFQLKRLNKSLELAREVSPTLATYLEQIKKDMGTAIVEDDYTYYAEAWNKVSKLKQAL